MTAKAQRNDPCPCGSGKKYKRCCLESQLEAAPALVLPEGHDPCKKVIDLRSHCGCGESHEGHKHAEPETTTG